MGSNDAYISKFKAKRRRRRFYLVPIYAFLALYLIAAGTGWFFLKSPFFRINKIEIVGNSTVSEGELTDLLKPAVLGHSFWKSVLGFNNILAWPAEISTGNLVFLPGIESLGVLKNYRYRSLVVSVKERMGFGTWCVKEECWLFDKDGFIFKRTISSEGSLINTIHDYSQSKLGLNSKILPDEFIPNAISVFNVLDGSGLNIKEIAIKDLSLREMEVGTYGGPKIYFSLTFPADNLLQVINDFNSRAGFKNMEYLDFRVENKLYYK